MSDRPDETGYNGWTNYETWCMALWIDNDQGSYECAREIANNVTTSADIEGRSRVGLLADALEAWKRETYYVGVELVNEVDGFLGDFLGAAWGRVNWHEIATGILSE